MIAEIKNKIFSALYSIDTDKLSLMELEQFTRIFDMASKIEEKSYIESMLDTFRSSSSMGLSAMGRTISEMKGENK